MLLYRYMDHCYISIDDEYSYSNNSDIKVELDTITVVRETKCYYYTAYNTKISKIGKNRYAFPTKQEALDNFLKRKKRQISILEAQLKRAMVSLNIGESLNLEVKDIV